MKHLVKTLMLGVIALVSIGFFHPVHAAVPAGFQLTTEVSGLNYPTSVANVPDGRLFITEKGGTVRVFKNGQLLAQPLIDISDHVDNWSDRGLLSMSLDKNFATNGIIYLAYAVLRPGKAVSDATTGRLVKVTLSSPTADVNNPAVNPPETIILGSVTTPYSESTTLCAPNTDCMTEDSPSHTVGTVVTAPDGTLFFSNGDGANFVTVDPNALFSQDLNRLNGKVLHIDTNGKGLASNPYYTGNVNDVKSKVYYYGLRNPFRLSINHDGVPTVTDVGWYSYEEVNLGAPGENFGWPCYEGNGHMNEYETNAQTAAQCQALYNTNTVKAPFYTFAHNPIGSGAAAVGGTDYTGTLYPAQYQDSYYYADYVSGTIKQISYTAAGGFGSISTFADGFINPVQMFSFANGDLGYISIWPGIVYRVSYITNTGTPTAVATASTTYGTTPLAVTFTGSNSTEPQNKPLTYLWDFGDGTTSTTANPTHTFTNNINYTVKLTVSNGTNTDSKQLVIYAGDQPTAVNIVQPSNNSGFISPATVHLKGTAVHPTEGVIPAANVNWKVIIHHNTHIHLDLDNIHLYETDYGVSYHGDQTYYELDFSATDSRGMVTTKTVNFYLYNAQNVCAANPVSALYNFSGNANDSSVSAAHNGVATAGLTYGVGRVSQGAVFGANSAVNIPSMTLNTFTFNVWLNPNDVNSINNILGNRNQGTQTNGFSLFWNAWNSKSHEVIFELGDGTNGKLIASPYETLVPNQWQMITVTYDGTLVTIYKNGVQVAQQPATYNFNKTGPLRLGQFMDGQWQYNGMMDDLSVWNSSLSAADVAALYTGDQAQVCQAATPGNVMFRINEYSAAGVATGNYVDGATINITDVTGATITTTATSANGWGTVNNLAPGTYGMMVFKAGYAGKFAQLDCTGAQNTTSITNANSQNLPAAWNNNLPITSGQTTWCRDVGLQVTQAQTPGNVMFKINELNNLGVATGNFVDGATIKITDVTGATVTSTATSANGWGMVNGITPGTYGMMVFKTGYKGISVQVDCAGTKTNTTLNNTNTGGLISAWNNNLPITSGQTTWCRDVTLQQL